MMKHSRRRSDSVPCACLGSLRIIESLLILVFHGSSSSSGAWSSHQWLMEESFVFQGKIRRPLFLLLIPRAEYMVS